VNKESEPSAASAPMTEAGFLSRLRERILFLREEEQLQEPGARAIVEDIAKRLAKLPPSEGPPSSSAGLLAALGVTLMLAATMWFFAANWVGMGRFPKLGLICGVLVGTYGIGGWLQYRHGGQPLLARLLILSGAFSFGIGLALIGQLYNSHANSYTLFLTWFVPVALLFQALRFPTLAVLCVLLANLTAWFLLFPEGLPPLLGQKSYGFVFYFLALNAVVTGLYELTATTDKSLLPARNLALFLVYLCFAWLGFWEVSGGSSLLYNALFLILLAGAFYRFLWRRFDPWAVNISLVAAVLWPVVRFVEFAIYHFSMGVFFFGLFFGLLLLGLNAWLIAVVTRLSRAARERDQSKAVADV